MNQSVKWLIKVEKLESVLFKEFVLEGTREAALEYAYSIFGQEQTGPVTYEPTSLDHPPIRYCSHCQSIAEPTGRMAFLQSWVMIGKENDTEDTIDLMELRCTVESCVAPSYIPFE